MNKKQLLTFLTFFMCWGFSNIAQAATTYYVRTDGGSDTQCNGKADAPYPGSGSNQACAFTHPFYVLSAAGSPNRMVGGDTLIIGPGQYMMGLGAPNTPSCSQYYPWDCSMRAVPSGTAANPTRILGKGYDKGCASKPQLWGTERSASIFDLRSSSNVELQCLEITDHSSCIESGPDQATRCNRESYPYGPWAMLGIVAADSSNVLLKHLNIHGLRTGILAGRVSNWTVENTDIIANSFIGWDGDIGADVSSNSGKIIFKNSKIKWSGCGETYPGLQPHHCYSQDQGGYGDGLGTHHTDGDWVFDHVDVSYNVSDGIDLLYHTGKGSIAISRSRFEGNAGNQVKIAAKTKIDNSKLIGNCAYFNGKSFTSTTGVGFNAVAFNNCRAGGNTIAAFFHPGMQLEVYNSTITGNGDVLIQSSGEGCLSTDKVVSKNNIYIGGPEFNNGGEDKADLYYAAGAGGNGDGACGNVPFSSSNDIIWGTKNNSTKCTGTNSKCVDPKVVGPINYGSDNQDVSLQSTSPAIKSAVTISNLLNTDFNNYDRGASWDAGSLQFGSVPTNTTTPTPPVTPSPVCGNGILETGEQCDGTSLNGQSCTAKGFLGGVLGCSSSCAFNTSTCLTSLCGNGAVDAGEQCDGVNLAGQTCLMSGFLGGVISCAANCTLNTAGCVTSLCGNGVVDSGEQCDGSKLNSQTCVSQGFAGGTLGCSACVFNTSGCLANACGNGKIEQGEECDGSSLGSQTCASQGFAGGTLKCSSCKFNTTGCLDKVCGNGVIEGGEQCEGSNLDSQTCASQGFAGGTLKCSSCMFNTSSCVKTVCGNGILEEGEQCDGNHMNSQTCTSQGFAGGTLGCSACKFNTASCDKAVCGNGVVEDGEQCDGSNFSGQSCATNGFAGGDLRCSSCTVDTASCVVSICGNGKKEANEVCDDGNLNSNDGCTSACKSEYCGDGIKQNNEVCDDGNWNNRDGCSALCKLEAVCGNGVIEGTEQCDGSSFNGQTCATNGFAGGNLSCSNCTVDTAECLVSMCGNGKKEANEVCDDGNLTNNDGCTSACKSEYCGDGIKQANEGCDDGNWNNRDGCSALCKVEKAGCGNGVIDGTEKCDDGNTNNNDGCSSTCRTEYCGDGVKQAKEGCDDGNWVNRDGCSALCKVEQPVCGNWYAEYGEQCDGDDLKGQSCGTRGFASGTLSCSSSCTYDTSACSTQQRSTRKFRF